LFGQVPVRDSQQPCIWFHAVSVGEVNLLAPVLKLIKNQRPDIEIVISTSTETGFDLAQKKYAAVSNYVGPYVAESVFFFPFDFTWAIRNAIQRVRPSLIVLAELELWPNFIQVVSQFDPDFGRGDPVGNSEECGDVSSRSTGIPVAIMNGRLSESSFRGYQAIDRWKGGRFIRESFEKLQLVLAQDETYASRFKTIGCNPNRVSITGSVKFDGIETNRNNDKTQYLYRLAEVNESSSGVADVVFVAGSTQFEEDIMAAKVYQKLAVQNPQLRLILVPRHPERVPQLVRALRDLGLTTQLRSELTRGGCLTSDERNGIEGINLRNRVLIVDVIGELGAWWGVADAAYVGGSMGSRGGQNMIEPAAYGIPVSFGPNTSNFKEVVFQLLSNDVATVVHDQGEMEDFVDRVIHNPDWARQTGLTAQNLMLQHNGASDRTVKQLVELLPSPDPLCDINSAA
jgi:3-deoxy-D-manno-octulosonic-acid transferase